MTQHPADNMLWVGRDPLRRHGMTKLVNRVAMALHPSDLIAEVRGLAKLHPLVVQRVVGNARPAI